MKQFLDCMKEVEFILIVVWRRDTKVDISRVQEIVIYSIVDWCLKVDSSRVQEIVTYSILGWCFLSLKQWASDKC
jgi:hypothetical protein